MNDNAEAQAWAARNNYTLNSSCQIHHYDSAGTLWCSEPVVDLQFELCREHAADLRGGAS